MWLVSTMFSLAGIFVILDAPFLAAIQVLVYAGAVMVLFLFVIMLLNLDVTASDVRGSLSIGGAVAVTGLLIVELGALWVYTPDRLAQELLPAGATTFPGGDSRRCDVGQHRARRRQAALRRLPHPVRGRRRSCSWPRWSAPSCSRSGESDGA